MLSIILIFIFVVCVGKLIHWAGYTEGQADAWKEIDNLIDKTIKNNNDRI